MKLLKITGLLLFSLLLCGCVKTNQIERSRFSGDHTTAKIRGMWSVCFQTRAQNQPFYPAPVHMIHCDCMIDKSREQYKDSDYKKIGQSKLTEFYKSLHEECKAEQSMRIPLEPDESSV